MKQNFPKTIDELKLLNKNFFQENKVQDQEVESRFLFSKYFITSEKLAPEDAKRYTVRIVDINSLEVDTIGEFMEHEKYQDANNVIEALNAKSKKHGERR